MEDSTLWRHVIAAKYGPYLQPSQSTLKLFRGPWKSIIQHKELILDNIVSVIGNGGSTSFWHDQWIGPSPLKDAYPRLFALNSSADVWINETSSWNLQLRRHLTGNEIDECSCLFTIIFPPPSPLMEDGWKWPIEPKGTFTVRSLSHKLSSSGANNHKDLYSCIWKGSIPKKIKFFL